MKVVRSSPLRIGRLYPQEFSWYSFLEAESTLGHMVPSVASQKIPSDITGVVFVVNYKNLPRMLNNFKYLNNVLF
jgi:hypothetical protein